MEQTQKNVKTNRRSFAILAGALRIVQMWNREKNARFLFHWLIGTVRQVMLQAIRENCQTWSQMRISTAEGQCGLPRSCHLCKPSQWWYLAFARAQFMISRYTDRNFTILFCCPWFFKEYLVSEIACILSLFLLLSAKPLIDQSIPLSSLSEVASFNQMILLLANSSLRVETT